MQFEIEMQNLCNFFSSSLDQIQDKEKPKIIRTHKIYLKQFNVVEKFRFQKGSERIDEMLFMFMFINFVARSWEILISTLEFFKKWDELNALQKVFKLSHFEKLYKLEHKFWF